MLKQFFNGLGLDYYSKSGVELVDASVKKAASKCDQDYRSDIDDRIAAYFGRWADYKHRAQELIDEAVGTTSQNYARLMELFPRYSVLRTVVNLLSQVYNSGVSRDFTKGGVVLENEAIEAPQALLNMVKWPERFRQAERYQNLCNSVLLWALPSWNGTVEVRVVEPSMLHCLPHPGYPNNLDAAYGVAIELPSDSGFIGEETKFVRYLRTDAGWHMDLTDARGDVLAGYTDEAKPLPMLPIIKVDLYDSQELFLQGGDDLLGESLNIARVLADSNLAGMFDAHPQMVVAGVEEMFKDAIRIGPGTVTALPNPDSSIKWLQTNGANKKYNFEALTNMIKLWLSTHGIPPTEFETETSERSGVAKFQSRQPMYERRSEAVPRWESAERDFWPRLLMVAVQEGIDIAEDIELLVNIKPPMPLLTESERLANWKLKIESGVATAVDYLVVEENMTRDAALKKVSENAQAARGVRPVPVVLEGD